MSDFAYAMLLTGAGSLILLDKWSFGEFGLSQPIVSCPLLGLIFGQLAAGLFLGTALQLVWTEALPLGSEKPPDYQSAGVIGITGYLLLQRLAGTSFNEVMRNQVQFVCLLAAAGAAVFGQATDHLLRRANDRLYELGINAPSPSRVFFAHLLAFVPAIARGVVLIGCFLIVLRAIFPFLSYLPVFTSDELLICPLAIGVAGLIRLFYRRTRLPFFLAGALVSAVVWILL